MLPRIIPQNGMTLCFVPIMYNIYSRYFNKQLTAFRLLFLKMGKQLPIIQDIYSVKKLAICLSARNQLFKGLLCTCRYMFGFYQ